MSHECDFPEWVRGLPTPTRARLEPVSTSRAIDHGIRSILQDTLAVYDIEVAQLERAPFP